MLVCFSTNQKKTANLTDLHNLDHNSLTIHRLSYNSSIGHCVLTWFLVSHWQESQRLQVFSFCDEHWQKLKKKNKNRRQKQTKTEGFYASTQERDRNRLPPRICTSAGQIFSLVGPQWVPKWGARPGADGRWRWPTSLEKKWNHATCGKRT